jgi:peptidoglycan/xylan/chitin deacetylase (PgdA/CDA1 family)
MSIYQESRLRSFRIRAQNHLRNKMALLFARRLRKWGGTEPFISFTFDDFPRSAYEGGGGVLRKYKIRGTYYTSMGLMGRDSPVGLIFSSEHLKEILDEGHELGCHTHDHVDAWDGKADVFERSIVMNREAVLKTIGHTDFKTMSYPKRHPHPRNKRVAGKYFGICRGGGQTFNTGVIDLNLVKSCFIDKINNETIETLKLKIDQNRKKRGWLIFSTHDVRDNPSRFGCTPEFFEGVMRYAVDSGAVILPVCEVYSSCLKSRNIE